MHLWAKNCNFRVERKGFNVERKGFRVERKGFRVERKGFNVAKKGFNVAKTGLYANMCRNLRIIQKLIKFIENTHKSVKNCTNLWEIAKFFRILLNHDIFLINMAKSAHLCSTLQNCQIIRAFPLRIAEWPNQSQNQRLGKDLGPATIILPMPLKIGSKVWNITLNRKVGIGEGKRECGWVSSPWCVSVSCLGLGTVPAAPHPILNVHP